MIDPSEHLNCLLCPRTYPPQADNSRYPGHCPTCVIKIQQGLETPMMAQSDGERIYLLKEREAKRDKILKQARAHINLRRKSFLHFVKFFGHSPTIPWVESWVADELCAHLQRVAEQTALEDPDMYPRLLVSMPPGHGKSTIALQCFVCWYIGHNPTHKVIIASYAQEVAERQSRLTQSIFNSPEYQEIFPGVVIDPKQNSIGNWGIKPHAVRDEDGTPRIVGGGNVYATGTTGATTSWRANLLVIDDPIKGLEQSRSQSERDKVDDWYGTAADTRGLPGYGVVLIGTRWHEDDLIGRRIEQQAHDLDLHERYPDEYPEPVQWHQIRFKAIATDDEPHRRKGEALIPELFPLRRLLTHKSQLRHRDWESLYQQSPYDEDGGFFKAEWMKDNRYKPANIPPDSLTVWNAWDLAISEKTTADYTVGVALGMDHLGKIYLLDLMRGRWSPVETTDHILTLHERYNATMTGIEAGMLETAIRPGLLSEMERREMRHASVVAISTQNKDKQMRAHLFAGLLEKQEFLMPEDGAFPWVGDLVAELIRFPNGRWDDQVDAISHGCYLYQSVSRPKRRRIPGEKPRSWIDEFDFDGQPVDNYRHVTRSTHHRLGMTA